MEVETIPGEGPSEYYYRRTLDARDLLPAIGVGVSVGLLAFYLARVMLERTPLMVPRRGAGSRAQQEEARARLTDPARERPARVMPMPGGSITATDPVHDVSSGGVRLGPKMMGFRTMSTVGPRSGRG